MAYATPQDLIDRFGLAELRQLAPQTPAGEPGYVVATVERALSDASAELDSHLAIRFAVPLAEVPELVEKFTCDLAREALDRTGRTHVLEAGRRARAWAKDIAQGKATLGSGPTDDPTSVPTAQTGGAEVMADDRVFTDQTLQAFLQ